MKHKKHLFNKALQYMVGNIWFQVLLERISNKTNYLMGIGSGGDVASSGEKAIFRLLLKLNNGPVTIFDVGSNKGQCVDIIKKQLKHIEYRIHCFEPGSAAFEILNRNKKNDPQIILNNLGLGQESGTRSLYYEYDGSGHASLSQRIHPDFDIKFNKSESVQLTTIDEYCAINNIQKIDLLKIDVEGHELEVLKGSQGMLKDRRIDKISFEFGGCNIDTKTYFRDFYIFFTNFGFKIFRITPSGFLYYISSYKECYEQFRTTNYLAC